MYVWTICIESDINQILNILLKRMDLLSHGQISQIMLIFTE